MTHQDLIHMLDKKYMLDPVTCPNEGKNILYAPNKYTDYHGAMAVHVSGAYLICGVCGAKVPTAVN